MKNKIKKIFQIYHDKNKVNSYVKDNILKLNPDYEYILLDFEEGKEIINKNFNKIKAKKICDCLDKLVKYCHKSDLLRYCLLYIYGGVYLDVDLKPFVSFDKLYDNDDVDFVCCFGQGGGFAPYSMLPKNDKCYFPVMANGFIMSRKPLNELLLYLIDKIISSNNYYLNILNIVKICLQK